MATNVTDVTKRPKAKGGKTLKLKPAEWVVLRITPAAAAELEELRSKRSLNNRIATKSTIAAEAIHEALIKETELMRENISVIMKRVGVRDMKVSG